MLGLESWYGYGCCIDHFRVPFLGDLQVLGVKKGEAFLSWYAKVLEFQSGPNQGLGLLS